MKLLPPEQDIPDRTPVWDCLQHLYMDTDVTACYGMIASVCGQSKYSIDQLEVILFQEVLPAVRFNMYALPAPEWAGFESQWLVSRVLSKHRFGKRTPWLCRKYTASHWKLIKPMISEIKAGEIGSVLTKNT